MKWTDELLDPKRSIMDPVADALVKRIVEEEGHETARKLFHTLIRNIDMPFDQVPAYVGDYFREQGKVSPQFDQRRILRGQEVFMDLGAWFALALYYKSLPTCYLNWRGVEVLHFTGRTEKGREWPERYARRIVETTQFLLDVMAPDALAPGGNGIATTLKVRMVHASIRYFILAEGEWNAAKLGMPLNQEDLAFTLMTFSVSMVEAMEQLGRPLSPADAEDYFYSWKFIGHILGIDADLIPDSVAEGRALLDRVLERQQGTSLGGRALTSALIEFGDLLLPTRFLDNANDVLLTFFMGDYRAQLLGVHEKKGCLSYFVPVFFRKSLQYQEKLEDRHPYIRAKSDVMGIEIIRNMQRRMNKLKGQGLRVHDAYKKRWGI